MSILETKTIENQGGRTALWDNIKFALIMLVVVGHFIESNIGNSHLFKTTWIFICSFHMPLFIFIAGLFHKNDRIKAKILGYLSVYIIFKIMVTLSKTVCGKDISLLLLKESGAPWYAFAMGVYIGLTYLLRDMNRKAVLLMAVVLGCCAGYDKTIGDVFTSSRVMVFFPFYYAGSVCSRKKLEQLAEQRKWKLAGRCFVLLTAVGITFLCSIGLFRQPTAYLMKAFDSRE